MRYQRKPLLVDAIQITAPTNLNGKVGQSGDYLLTLPNGELGFMPRKQFEANFEPAGATPPDLEEAPLKALMVCLGCGEEVEPARFERNTGMCVSCLEKPATCQTCGREIRQYEILGTACRKCLPQRE